MKTRLLIFFFFLSPLFALPQAGMWTWMHGKDTIPIQYNRGTKGVASPLNEAWPRYACGFWTDTAGNFWIYGDSNYDDDLWKLDPVTNMWTWVKGGASYQAIYGSSGMFAFQQQA